MKTTTIALTFIVAWVLAAPTGWAQKPDDKEHAELAKALKGAKISLERGLTARAKATGKVAKAEPITGGDDLTAAKAQSEAMAKAKRSLAAAAAEAVKESKGFRAVSVMPVLKDDHPVADVTLVKGTEWKSVSEKLD